MQFYNCRVQAKKKDERSRLYGLLQLSFV